LPDINSDLQVGPLTNTLPLQMYCCPKDNAFRWNVSINNQSSLHLICFNDACTIVRQVPVKFWKCRHDMLKLVD